MRILNWLLPDANKTKFLLGMIVGFFLALWAWGYMSGIRQQYLFLDNRLLALQGQLERLEEIHFATLQGQLERLEGHLKELEQFTAGEGQRQGDRSQASSP